MTTATRPLALAVRCESIPAELAERQQWVLWRYDMRDEKWTKTPYNARTGRHAKSTDAATWSSLAEARAAYERGGWDGIGFAVGSGDPFVAFDLDHCRDAATGTLEHWAEEIVRQLDSYAEVTPSGSGVRIIARGQLPPGRRRKGHFEVYDRARYVTITGHRLGQAVVEDRQEAIAAVHARMLGDNGQAEQPHAEANGHPLSDPELIEKAMAAKNGAKFRALWDGDVSAYGGDDSRADLALCGMLAFWTGGDAARIDALFRQSGLYRPKWKRADYRERTIAEALRGKTKFYRPGGEAQKLAKPTGYAIILEHFRTKYQPVFRRDTSLYSGRLGREVKIGEATCAPGIELVEKLARASDAPRDNKGRRNRGSLPWFFNTWAKSAWIDLLDPLPVEEAADEVNDPAQEQFRARVRAGLLHPYTLGDCPRIHPGGPDAPPGFLF